MKIFKKKEVCLDTISGLLYEILKQDEISRSALADVLRQLSDVPSKDFIIVAETINTPENLRILLQEIGKHQIENLEVSYPCRNYSKQAILDQFYLVMAEELPKTKIKIFRLVGRVNTTETLEQIQDLIKGVANSEIEHLILNLGGLDPKKDRALISGLIDSKVSHLELPDETIKLKELNIEQYNEKKLAEEELLRETAQVGYEEGLAALQDMSDQEKEELLRETAQVGYEEGLAALQDMSDQEKEELRREIAQVGYEEGLAALQDMRDQEKEKEARWAEEKIKELIPNCIAQQESVWGLEEKFPEVEQRFISEEERLLSRQAELFATEARLVAWNQSLATRSMELAGKKVVEVTEEVLFYSQTAKPEVFEHPDWGYGKPSEEDMRDVIQRISETSADGVHSLYDEYFYLRHYEDGFNEYEYKWQDRLKALAAANQAQADKLALWESELTAWESNLNDLETELAFRGTLYTKCYQLARQLRNWWNKEQNDLLGLPTLTRG
jgi:hypothetical protein